MTKITVDKELIEQAIEALPDVFDMAHFPLRQKLRKALASHAVEPIGYVRMLNGEPTPDDDGGVFSYGKNPYRDTYGDEEWVPVSLVTSPPPAEVPVAHVTVRPLQPDERERKVVVKWVNQPVAGPLFAAPSPVEMSPSPDRPGGETTSWCYNLCKDRT